MWIFRSIYCFTHGGVSNWSSTGSSARTSRKFQTGGRNACGAQSMSCPPSGSRAPSPKSRAENNRRLALSFRERDHIHFHVQCVPGTPQQNSVYGTDVAIVAPPGYGYMTIRGYAVVGGVEIHPAGSRTPYGAPCVRCVGADQARSARWRHGSQIATDITRRQSQRSHACDLQMGEILTDAAALFKESFDGSGNLGSLLVEAEILVDSM